MEIISPDHAQIQVDLNEAHAVSVGLISIMSDHELPVSTGVVAAALTVGRLLAPSEMDEDEEVEFLKAILGFVGAYFTEGDTN